MGSLPMCRAVERRKRPVFGGKAMVFLNEYISEEDLQKYKLRERFKAEIRRFPREPEWVRVLGGISF